MHVSVVVCTYPTDRYEYFSDAVESVLNQTYDDLDVVLVVDGNEEVHEWTVEDFGDVENVTIHCNEENRGISYSRTKGAELADGDIVAMIDDDAVAEPDWIETLVETYETTDAVAVGGHVKPVWQIPKPDFFPDEFYWLVGCDEKGFGEHMEEMRNTYGSNISFRRDVLLHVGGYDENTGRKGEKHIQAHESTVGAKIRREYGRGVIYNKEAVVNHKLLGYRGDFRWLVGRSFWQGYSKRIMDHIIPEASADKNEYLADLLLKYVPERIANLVKDPETAKVKQFVAIFVFTAAVGFGYLYAILTPNLLKEYN
ncbi:glucosyl-dolichyl phosphate glucuronosyltransferase [Haloarchaeobius sp. DFWS5]|uniref:glucosyl-dolichyl phosphate glucuronosyltransferase n=1 Tax=Haloarchaeobius sp. DFWS5 TaxID=3446114 RepID=UPI003EBA99E0